MGRAKQMPLFASAPPPPAPVDPEWVRRHLMYLLRMVQTAERLPWSEPKTATWEKLFRDLCLDLPDGEALQAAFETELKRLRSA